MRPQGTAHPPPRYLGHGVGDGGASQVLWDLHCVDTLVRELLWRVVRGNGALVSLAARHLQTRRKLQARAGVLH